jgi:predicted lipoprotein
MNMTRYLSYMLLAWCVILTSACTRQTPEHRAIIALYNTMTPHYAQWREASVAFATDSENFCAGKTTLAGIRQSWQQTMLAWSAVQALPVGPINDNSYSMQVGYWPDPKNLVAFQVEARLKNAAPPPLAESSAALRSLTAAEYILFDSGHDLAQDGTRQYYCPLLTAIGAYQTTFSGKIEKEWQGFSTQITTFPSTRFASEQEALTEFLRVQVATLDSLGKRFQEPLKSGRVQIYQLEHWRSGQTEANLYAAVTTHATLWKNGWRILATEKNIDATKSNNTTNNTGAIAGVDTIKDIDQSYAGLLSNISPTALEPLSVSITTAEGVAWVRNRQSELRTLDKLYGGSLAPALGVQIGFNANDGD